MRGSLVMLLRTPAAVTPVKNGFAAGAGVFHARDIAGTELSRSFLRLAVAVSSACGIAQKGNDRDD
jgi:hypothetical protein